jgi:NADPH-dependent glutamate synthase beta subunit-like oxidoreductase/NAD-dependent dihydropyrimidine dehydrogenase PreA subunit/flavodoxin
MTLTDTNRLPAGTDRPYVRIITDRCAGCQECVIRCPTGALSMDTKHWVALADDDLCVGCRQCVRTCPFSAIVVEGPLLVARRFEPEPVNPEHLLGDIGEIRSGLAGWPEALAEAERCLQCPDPTCIRGCPAHNDIPGFIGAVRDRDLESAHEILRRTSVLPDICSRVCNQSAQCEGACSWSLAGGTPVSIGRLERFITDNLAVPPPASAPSASELSVGIIGSGPAGAGAAWDLLEAGASVTVYEKEATPGGLCVWGIPDFTLPEVVATRPWRQLSDAGLDLRCSTTIRPEDLDGLLVTHDAVIVAHGAGMPLRLPVPGADLDGVVDATMFLQGAKAAFESNGDPAGFCTTLGLAGDAGEQGHPAPEILVLGAGNTAMDVARTARRLGLRATCVDWLDERFALARPDELAEARHEGVEVRFSRTLTALHGSAGRVVRAELALTTQKRADQHPKVFSQKTEELQVDLVVMAMGYRSDPAFADALPGTPLRREASGVPDRRWTASGILANRASAFAHHSPVGRLALGREVALRAAALPVSERLWAVGDALTGPATVVEAMAQGRRAAAAVLDSRPTRPGRSDRAWSSGQRRVLVCYESSGGKTARAAEAVADGFSARGDQVRVLPIAKVGTPELAAADLVVIGTWVEGFVVAGVRPAKAMRSWLDGLPRLAGKPIGMFCTFAVSPKDSLRSMRKAVEAKGALVVAQAAFGPGELGAEPGVFGPAAFGEKFARQATIQAVSQVLVE